MRFACLVIGCLLATPAASEEGAYLVARDWVAGCDNTRVCRAVGVAPESSDEALLILDRAPAGGARPVLRLRLARPEIDRSDGARDFDFVADGRVIGRLFERNLQLDGERGEWRGTIADDRLVDAIVDAARTARQLALAWPNGNQFARLSLDGAAAALLFIDERQRRLGTRGALVPRGDRPDQAVPPPPRAPAPPAQRRASGRAPSAVPPAVQALFDAEPEETCNRDADPERQPPQFHALGGRAALVGINCWAGAYQFTHAFYLVRPGSAPQRLALPRPSEVRPSEPERGGAHLVTSPDFDPESGILIEFSKGRGLGDCGSTAQWQWNGRAFVLLAYRVMPLCRGLLTEDWIELHRTAEPPPR